MTWLLSHATLPLLGAAALVLVLVLLALLALGDPPATATMTVMPWWDLPLRMAAATGMVLTITATATLLGPKWSGLLSPFPVFASVMAVFTHRHDGATRAQRLLRGVLVGSFAFASFFVVVGLLLPRLSLAATYLLAAATALTVNGLSLLFLLRRPATG